MKSIKIAAVAMAAAALLAACSEEQSTFNIENVPGRCTLQGKIVYNQGTTYENGKFVYDYKPLANTEVTVTIDNGAFGSYAGESTFTTTTDEQGFYTIEVPAPKDDASVRVTTPDFITVRKVIKMINNKIQTVEEEVVLRGDKTFYDVHAQGIVLASFACIECNRDENYSGFNEYATISGTIGQNAEYKVNATPIRNEEGKLTSYLSASRYYVFVPAAGVDLIVTVSYPNEGDFTYNATTDANGDFKLSIPVEGFPTSFSYSLTMMPYDGKFTHYEAVEREYTVTDYFGNEITRTYTDYTARTLTGYYAQEYDASFSANLPVAAQSAQCESKSIIFSPLDNGQDTYGYNKSVFSPGNMWLDELKAMLEEQANN